MADSKFPNDDPGRPQTAAQLVDHARDTYAAARAAVCAYAAFETLLTIAANAQAPELTTDKDDIAALRTLVRQEADRRLEEAADAVGSLLLGR